MSLHARFSQLNYQAPAAESVLWDTKPDRSMRAHTAPLQRRKPEPHG
jgi:hypothetical protein